MSKTISSALAAATLGALLCLPMPAAADFSSHETHTSTAHASAASPGATLDFLSSVLAKVPAGTDALTRGPAQIEDHEVPADRESLPALVEHPRKLRGDSDLFLWNLLAIVHSHHHDRHFESLHEGISFVVTHHADAPAAVPLPGALWLFVMGVLGLAGTRLTGGGGVFGSQGQRERAPSMPIGGAVPA